MLVIVGSTNPAKIEAVRCVIEDYDFLKPAQLEAREVTTGVTPQPMNVNDMITGAMRRARRAYESKPKEPSRLGVGLESGLMRVPLVSTGYLEATVCAIHDGQRWGHGMSSAFECPTKVIGLIEDFGMDLSEASKSAGITKKDNLGAEEGIIGILTNGRVTRKDYTIQAVRMALIPFEHPELYRP